ncbi:MAG: ECF-type sigma factor [Planctomycetota bacterium]
MAGPEHTNLTQLLAEAGGREDLWMDILPLVYDELKGIAERRMSDERGHHTLQATALVHEAWMRLVGDDGMAWSSRRHFFGAAARAMQRVLVDHARRVNAEKRGGGAARVSISVGELTNETDPEALLALDDALNALEREDPRSAEVARLRLFAGIEVAAVAKAMELSERTVAREWAYARARLADLLGS